MSAGGALRAAAADFYRQSWRLAILNTLLSAVLLSVLYLTFFVQPVFVLLAVLLGPCAAALMHCAVRLAQEEELRAADALTGLRLHWLRGTALAAVILFVVWAGIVALRFYGDKQWLLAVLVGDVLAVFAVLQIFVWPRAVHERSRPLRVVHADALADFLRRPVSAFAFALALILVNGAGIVAAVMPFLTLTIAYSFLAVAHFALPRSAQRAFAG